MPDTKQLTHKGLKILAGQTRFRILCLLRDTPEGLCVKEIAESIDLSHSATSHQLARLEDHGVVVSERDGQTICYRLKSSELTDQIMRILHQC